MQWWSDYLDSFFWGAKRRNLSGENGKNQGVKTAEFKVNLP